MQEAADSFRRALDAAPDEPELAVNLSEALYGEGQIEEALAALSRFDGRSPREILEGAGTLNSASHVDPRISNQIGNIFVKMGNLEKAAAEYERGLRAHPDDMDLLQNAASVYMELDMYGRADELLRRALDVSPDSEVYNLMGNLTVLTGELERAETLYRMGMEADPGNHLLRGNYADLLIRRKKYREADDLLSAGRVYAESPRGRRQKEEIADALEIRLECFSCGLTWKAPRDIEPQQELRIRGEPPAECPAGRCPQCGRVYCVGCGKRHLEGDRFVCAGCGVPLKLSDDYIRYIVSNYVSNLSREDGLRET
jgi:tetratricopeptide (TPR) repeat protein